ncbi:MAG: hypothetical protein M1834_001445 [Cirrosporium novae-zelandiae]|nr:MAG: hypothetical protein M1834_001445 [Cirrosporium novae-zelandiae]
MASVSSLDKDLRNMRLAKYTPQAANQIREWIEEVLGQTLPSGDLLEALKDGVALCQLVNLAVGSPGVKFKRSAMPFVQMENISQFLHACQIEPLNLPPHDVFLTVDLYEAKDPAQVLQCLSSFSRRANALQPSKFPRVIGAKSKGGVVSPQSTGARGGRLTPAPVPMPDNSFTRSRGASNVSNVSNPSPSTFDPTWKSRAGAISPVKTGGSPRSASPASGGGLASPRGNVSSWSKKVDENKTAPAWNIHQYGYMGGASQGNQGISFGARRQITTPGPQVPSLAEKERRRREQQAENDRLRVQAEEAEHKRRIERAAEEERTRIEEEKQWEEETQAQRERERKEAEEEKLRWEAEERRWKEEEEARLREEREAEARVKHSRDRKRTTSDARLQGQFLSQYQAEQHSHEDDERTAGRDRVKELERQLAEAKERERQYELERQGRSSKPRDKSRTRSRSRPRPPPRVSTEKLDLAPEAKARSRSRSRPPPAAMDGPKDDERAFLAQSWSSHNKKLTPPAPPKSPRPLPDPTALKPPKTPPPPTSPRPLPDPAAYTSPPRTKVAGVTQPQNRTDKFLHAHPYKPSPKPATHFPAEMGLTSTSEVDAENARRAASQQKTKAGGWASKSLLEREMERERERQKEWEESQKKTKELAVKGVGADGGEGTGEGQSWDVNQYGWIGGDNQNKGSSTGSGIGFGGRRQIIGPRPPP